MATTASGPVTWRIDTGGADSSMWPTVTTPAGSQPTAAQMQSVFAKNAASTPTVPSATGAAGSSDYMTKVMNLLQPVSSTDYLSEAKSALAPSIAARVAPLTAEQSLIPEIYGQAKTQVGQGRLAALGQQRATAAASGITSTSGVEQSQEANIASTWAGKLTMLTTQESQSLLDVASKIADIYGQGESEALTYASDLAKMVADESYRQAEVAIQLGDQNTANARLDEAVRHDQATEYLQGLTAGAVTPKIGPGGEATGFTTPAGGYFQSQQPNLFDKIKSAITGTPTQTDEVFAKSPDGTFGFVPRSQAADAQAQGYILYQ